VHRTQILKEPSECSEAELAEFERLVRMGFGGSDDSLSTRVRNATCLAFQYDPEHGLVAIAGLKQPRGEHRAEMFANAGCDLGSDEWRVELGWVFVTPMHRGSRIALVLCEKLLQRLEGNSVFATTRPDNVPMIRILESLGFKRGGKPFLRPTQELVLFIRWGKGTPGSGAIV